MRANLTSFTFLLLLSVVSEIYAADARPAWQVEWERTIEAAKKEGKVVAGLPASAELRKLVIDGFKARHPYIELDATASRGPTNASKIAAEHSAGARYFDVLLSGTSTPFSLLQAGILEPVEPLLILPEVKDPKRWYGGHDWLDNTKKFIYTFQAYQSEIFWYNTTITKPDELRAYDDLLLPKWKGKIGILDPRSPGAGTATWAYFLKVKGEDYLRKLAAQEMFQSRDQRQLADSLAKGKINLTIGLSYYSFAPFIKAGLPIKPFPELKEGTYTSNGSGALSVVKNSPHPNATKVFVNWLLSKEGQEAYSRGIGQATRRLDVDTKWLVEQGTKASKDFLTVEENDRRENYGEDTVMKIWSKAYKIAEEVFK